MQTSQILYTRFSRHCMDWSKPLEPGMSPCPNSWLRITSQEVRLIKLSFIENIMDLVYLFKFMLMTLFLDLLIKTFARSLLSLCKVSMKRAWWVNWHTFLVCKSNNLRMASFISQTKYILDLLKKFDLTECSSAKILMVTATKLEINTKKTKVDISNYRGMIGSLLYLTASRPDIMFLTCLCARFQADPRESHLIAIKRIFRYLKGTTNLGIWFPRDSGFDLIGCSDADYPGCRIDEKSTTCTCQFLGNKLVSWFSKKRHSVSTSTAESWIHCSWELLCSSVMEEESSFWLWLQAGKDSYFLW